MNFGEKKYQTNRMAKTPPAIVPKRVRVGREFTFLEKICGIQYVELSRFAKSQNGEKLNQKWNALIAGNP